MPTKRHGKVRKMLKSGEAKVYRRHPFTIQILRDVGKETQATTLGMDPGYEKVGVSVVSQKRELFSAEYTLRTDIQKKLEAKRMYRRNRRNRLRYRKPRFLNRKKAYAAPPSVRHKVESHTRILAHVASFLPIDKVVLEIAKFDPHKLKDPTVQGEGYQKGEQYGLAYLNIKEYVKQRDGHRCHFHGKDCTKRLEVHHIHFRSEGGSDAPGNLITVCSRHHKELHEGKAALPQSYRPKRLRSATFMNIVIARLKELLPDIEYTFGYQTKAGRYAIGLDKSHANDAFVIAGGNVQLRAELRKYVHKRKNNRSLGKQRKGFAPSSRKQRYPIQPGDLVRWEGEVYRTKGMHQKGKRLIVPYLGKNKSVAVSKVDHIFYNRTTRRA